VFAADAKALGFNHVYRARASIAQPDFTAECLSSRNAGVEVLLVALDQNSVARVAVACARQGFHPIFALPGQVVSDELAGDPNLAGAVGQSAVFPYVQSGTPAA